MKNYKVKATRDFTDGLENKDRKLNDEFYCTKERYEFLVSKNNAVELVRINEEEVEYIGEDTETAVKLEDDKNEINEEEVQAVAIAISEFANENNKTIEKVVNDIIEEANENETEKKDIEVSTQKVTKKKSK